MVSLQEPLQPKPEHVIEPISNPRLSFYADSLDDNNFISISSKRDGSVEIETGTREIVDFEFLSGDKPDIVTADELFCEGKLLPFWQMEKLNKIELKTMEDAREGPTEDEMNNEKRISWFLDDDPSPRPPNCSVLWKELLRLKKRRPPTLSPSSSSSSSESLSVGQRKEGGERMKIKKGLERTRSDSMRIRPMINVPICTAAKNPSLPPLFPLRRRRLES